MASIALSLAPCSGDDKKGSEINVIKEKNSLWIGSGGPKYTRVSGVLFTCPINPWNIPTASVWLFHSPWGKIPYNSPLSILPQAILKEARIEWIPGVELYKIKLQQNFSRK
ncbi:MAG: hypothetical protein M1609_04255 [Firmicutes bacterium]|nr:hypothetical protein [Bacillota bacterium]